MKVIKNKELSSGDAVKYSRPTWDELQTVNVSWVRSQRIAARRQDELLCAMEDVDFDEIPEVSAWSTTDTPILENREPILDNGE